MLPLLLLYALQQSSAAVLCRGCSNQVSTCQEQTNIDQNLLLLLSVQQPPEEDHAWLPVFKTPTSSTEYLLPRVELLLYHDQPDTRGYPKRVDTDRHTLGRAMHHHDCNEWNCARKISSNLLSYVHRSPIVPKNEPHHRKIPYFLLRAYPDYYHNNATSRGFTKTTHRQCLPCANNRRRYLVYARIHHVRLPEGGGAQQERVETRGREKRWNRAEHSSSVKIKHRTHRQHATTRCRYSCVPSNRTEKQ